MAGGSAKVARVCTGHFAHHEGTQLTELRVLLVPFKINDGIICNKIS